MRHDQAVSAERRPDMVIQVHEPIPRRRHLHGVDEGAVLVDLALFERNFVAMLEPPQARPGAEILATGALHLHETGLSLSRGEGLVAFEAEDQEAFLRHL